MPDQFTSSIVSILTKKGAIVGAGFLVSKSRVITCAHVAAQALGISPDTAEMPDGKVYLDFPLVEKEKSYTAKAITGRVIFWRPTSCPSDRGSDISVLKLEQDSPAGSQAGRLVTADDLWEHTCRAFGFPGGYDNGVWAAGILNFQQP